MIESIPPQAIFVLGAFLIPFLRGHAKKIYLLLIPTVAFIDLLYMSQGTYWVYRFMEYNLIFGRVDRLSLCFGYVFVLMAICGNLYALHVKENGQHTAAFFYIGSALGVIFSGDYFTLFVFWEAMAFSSFFLIWYQKSKAAIDAGFRYILVHAFGGSCLLAGIVIHSANGGSLEFGLMQLEGLGSYLILIAFILNAAVPPLHAWLSDAYPEATVTGAVFLTAYTTKSAVYVLIRAFPGAEILVWLGAVMAVYGVIFAVLENDGRRLLAYHIISQVGYMICGVGIGTTMAINGAVAHAFSHILYKALLFMGMGAVIQMSGKRKLTELGGVYKTMPLTLILYMVGAFSISGVPLFNGFISKPIIVSAAALDNRPTIELMLHLASVGTFLHTGLKLPYFTFFAKDIGIRTREPPLNMLFGMGLTAFLCIFLGIFPQVLYNILPYYINYVPYTTGHVVGTLQLLLFTFVAFWLLRNKLGGESTITLDTDWLYRKMGPKFIWFCHKPLMKFANYLDNKQSQLAKLFIEFSRSPTKTINFLTCLIHLNFAKLFHSEKTRKLECRLEEIKVEHKPVQRRPIGLAVLLITAFLAMYLLIYYAQ